MSQFRIARGLATLVGCAVVAAFIVALIVLFAYLAAALA